MCHQREKKGKSATRLLRAGGGSLIKGAIRYREAYCASQRGVHERERQRITHPLELRLTVKGPEILFSETGERKKKKGCDQPLGRLEKKYRRLKKAVLIFLDSRERK